MNRIGLKVSFRRVSSLHRVLPQTHFGCSSTLVSDTDILRIGSASSLCFGCSSTLVSERTAYESASSSCFGCSSTLSERRVESIRSGCVLPHFGCSSTLSERRVQSIRSSCVLPHFGCSRTPRRLESPSCSLPPSSRGISTGNNSKGESLFTFVKLSTYNPCIGKIPCESYDLMTLSTFNLLFTLYLTGHSDVFRWYREQMNYVYEERMKLRLPKVDPKDHLVDEKEAARYVKCVEEGYRARYYSFRFTCFTADNQLKKNYSLT